MKSNGLLEEFRLRLRSAPPDRMPCPSRMSAQEVSIRKYVEEPTQSVITPELGISFDSLGDGYDFYTLYSWEVGLGVRYGKNRLNAERTKSVREIVCGCWLCTKKMDFKFVTCRSADLQVSCYTEKQLYVTCMYICLLDSCWLERIHWNRAFPFRVLQSLWDNCITEDVFSGFLM